jgi:hypothetical protein
MNYAVNNAVRSRLVFCMMMSAFLIGCGHHKLDFNAGNRDLNLTINRFDQDLFAIPPDSVAERMPSLLEKYGKFIDLFGYIINIGESTNPTFPSYLEAFLSDPINKEVYTKTQEVFPDLSWLEKKLTGAFRYYKYYFPGKPVPRIYTYVSRFNHTMVVDEDVLAIGLDKYLGADVDYYVRLGLPKYIRDNMVPEKIPSDCMFYWASTEYPFSSAENNVLHQILYYGKLLYFTEAMLPKEPERSIIGYTEDQVKWCYRNESAMFDYLVEKKLLFDNNYLTINKLVGEGPFTSFFSQESPGRAGSWLGWQIIRSYMRENPNVSLANLMMETDYQKIFEIAHYKP